MSNDGGPAFPTRLHQPFGEGRMDMGGMSLRDYFAVAERSEPPVSWWQSRRGSYIETRAHVELLGGVQISEGLAAWRYQCADAMLKAREQ